MRWIALVLFACTHAGPRQSAPSPALELVESEPVETTLDRPELREAWQVWPEMIARASARLDFAEMYAVDEGRSRLTPIVEAVEKAAARGVRVRFLAAASFAKTYPQVLAALEQHGVQVRKLEKPFLHAKYFVADGADVKLVASAHGTMPDEKFWDLPALVEIVNSARKSVRVQALTYSEVPDLSDALLKAAARGVSVQLILSDWELRPKTLAALR